MSTLVFPSRVELTAQVWNGRELEPYHGAPLVFGILTFARARNDYQLGPLFTNEQGVLVATSHQLELCAQAHASAGIMDVMNIHESFSFIEIVHWSPEQVATVLNARTTSWAHLWDGEAELYGSLEALVARLRQAGNRQFLPPFAHYGRVRDEWVDASQVARYTYALNRVLNSREDR